MWDERRINIADGHPVNTVEELEDVSTKGGEAISKLTGWILS